MALHGHRTYPSQRLLEWLSNEPHDRLDTVLADFTDYGGSSADEQGSVTGISNQDGADRRGRRQRAFAGVLHA
jgi:hypothetical protein